MPKLLSSKESQVKLQRQHKDSNRRARTKCRLAELSARESSEERIG